MGGRDLAGLPSRVERFIGDDLRQVEQIFRQELDSQNPYVADIFAHVAHFRGKRLRPMLLLLSASAAGPINEAHRVLGAVVDCAGVGTDAAFGTGAGAAAGAVTTALGDALD